MITTPSRITADIRRMCHRRIQNVDAPIFVAVSPRADSKINDCFHTVRQQVAEHGGSIQHGWTIWESPGIYLEAEFHAVWRSPDGRLLDVSRKLEKEQQIVFSADHVRVFSGRRMDNIRMALSNDPRVTELLDIFDWLHAILKEQGKDVPIGGEISLSEDATQQLACLRERANQLLHELSNSRRVQRARKA